MAKLTGNPKSSSSQSSRKEGTFSRRQMLAGAGAALALLSISDKPYVYFQF